MFNSEKYILPEVRKLSIALKKRKAANNNEIFFETVDVHNRFKTEATGSSSIFRKASAIMGDKWWR